MKFLTALACIALMTLGSLSPLSAQEDLVTEILTNRDIRLISPSKRVAYRIVTPGEGARPTGTDAVAVSYRGMLINGVVFEESEEPLEFIVNEIIEGWTIALQEMPVGSTWRIYLLPELAYGDQGAGPIPPNATLVFDITLHGIIGDAEPIERTP